MGNKTKIRLAIYIIENINDPDPANKKKTKKNRWNKNGLSLSKWTMKIGSSNC